MLAFRGFGPNSKQSHFSHACNALSVMRKQDKFSDLQFVCKDDSCSTSTRIISAHQAIFSELSTMLNSLFIIARQKQPYDSVAVTLDSVSASTVEKLMEYVYEGKTTTDSGQRQQLMNLCSLLELEVPLKEPFIPAFTDPMEEEMNISLPDITKQTVGSVENNLSWSVQLFEDGYDHNVCSSTILEQHEDPVEKEQQSPNLWNDWKSSYDNLVHNLKKEPCIEGSYSLDPINQVISNENTLHQTTNDYRSNNLASTPIYPYQCVPCDREFSNEVLLNIHNDDNHIQKLFQDPNEFPEMNDLTNSVQNTKTSQGLGESSAKRNRSEKSCVQCNKENSGDALLNHLNHEHHIQGLSQAHDKYPKLNKPQNSVQKSNKALKELGKSLVRRKRLGMLKEKKISKQHRYHCLQCKESFPYAAQYNQHNNHVHHSSIQNYSKQLNKPKKARVVDCTNKTSGCVSPISEPKRNKSPKIKLPTNEKHKQRALDGCARSRIYNRSEKSKEAVAVMPDTSLSTNEKMKGMKPIKCQYCNMSFRSNKLLAMHVTYIHTKEKKYHCHDCGSKFVESTKLKIHMRVHTGERPYKCPDCSYASKTQSGIKCHILSHKGEQPFSCDICNKRYTVKHSMMLHRLSHTGETPSFPCGVCPKSFTREFYRKIHTTNMHSDIANLSCDNCNLKCRDKYTLKIHKKIHKR